MNTLLFFCFIGAVSSRKSSLAGEHRLGCNVGTVAADLEVAVVAAGTSRAAHIADELALVT